MNKLLFYADFLSYREQGFSLSGLSYKALDFGPVPEQWTRIYTAFDEIVLVTNRSLNYEGLFLSTNNDADESLFSGEEISILRRICDRFGQMTSRELSELSHREPAWKNALQSGQRLDFNDAFDLRGI